MRSLTVFQKPKSLYMNTALLIKFRVIQWRSNSHTPILYIILSLILKEKMIKSVYGYLTSPIHAYVNSIQTFQGTKTVNYTKLYSRERVLNMWITICKRKNKTSKHVSDLNWSSLLEWHPQEFFKSSRTYDWFL